MDDVIKRGKFSILASTKEPSTEDTPHVNEIKLQKGLWLTSTPEGIFLHITINDEIRIAKLIAEAADPLALSLYEWAQKLVDDRTYN